MRVQWTEPGDAKLLREWIAVEQDAKQRDRYRVVLIAGEGLAEQKECEREAIAAVVGRSRQFVDQWVRRYRRGGLEAMHPKKQPGATPKLSKQQEQMLCEMLEAGPPPEEGGGALAAYNGPILREKIQECFGVLYSLSAVYALLHRLKYNDLMPRTTHPETDPERLEAFKKKSCPPSSKKSVPCIRANAS